MQNIFKVLVIAFATGFFSIVGISTTTVYAHTYYNNHCPSEGIAKADAIAKSIADRVMANPNYKTDLDKVSAAAREVAQYTARGKYGADANKYYRTPYGVFVTGNWTCAGSTRALGRVLDFMGYEWTHVNENEWLHQWNVLYMDGQIGYADAAVINTGRAGYGTYEWGEQVVREAKARQNR